MRTRGRAMDFRSRWSTVILCLTAVVLYYGLQVTGQDPPEDAKQKPSEEMAPIPSEDPGKPILPDEPSSSWDGGPKPIPDTKVYNGTYAVVAPKIMRPGSVYRCCLTLFSGVLPVTFQVRLQNVNLKEALVSGSDTLSVPLKPTATVELQIPAYVPPGTYNLTIEGSGGETFSTSKPVTVAKKRLSIFIQTDKSLYKPGQTVLFRCIAVYSNLLPYKNEMNITIFDQNDNKINQWLNVNDQNGVIGHDLKLADQTPLGTWRIECAAGGNLETHTFTVAEYVLPKYEVSVVSPDLYLVNLGNPSLQQDFYAVVKAMYTYGQPVKGMANITVQLQHYEWEDSSQYGVKIIIAQLVDGAAQIQLTVDELTAIAPDYSWSNDKKQYLASRVILIKANVLENVTGVILSGEKTVQCTSSKNKLQFMDITPKTYRKGMPFTGYLQLTTYDGSVLDMDDFKNPGTGEYHSITVTASMSSSTGYPQYQYSNAQRSVVVTLDKSGYMEFTMTFDDNATSVYITATIQDESTSTPLTAYSYPSLFNTRDTQAGIQIEVSETGGAVKPDTTVTFVVTTKTETQTIYYQVLGKGQIVISGSVSSLIATTEHTFEITVTTSLALTFAPALTVVGWYRSDTLELVADSIKLTVSGGFANQVSLTFDKEKAKPGDDISLTVNAAPGSLVAIRAVDLSVKLLQPGNEFTQDSVMSDLEKYTSDTSGDDWGGPMPGRGIVFRRKRSAMRMWWPYSPGGTDTTAVFNNAGMIIDTDCYLYKVQQYWWPDYGIRDDFAKPAPGAPGAPAQPDNPNTDQGSGGSNKEPPRTRSNFPETWLWITQTAGSGVSSVTFSVKVPDTITKWIASAFAVDPTHGLGVADTDAEITVFQTFFISVTLPYSVKRGEEFAFIVTVFNYFNQTLSVTVTLKQSTDFKVRMGKNGKEQSTDVPKIISVASNDAASVYYWMVPQTLGLIPIDVVAESSAAGDAMQSTLLVKPEGVERSYSTAVLIQLTTNGQPFSSTVNTTLPPKGVLVPGSQHITCTAIGDIMGPSIQGLEKLIQMPTGCGEQNMLGLAPDVSVALYLQASGQWTAELLDKITSYMLSGYQRELTYQHTDGSFSAFGNGDKSGSTWLTAFVLKVFCQAKPYIPVEDDKMAKTMYWVIGQQNGGDGSFNEPGMVIHTDMQGGSSSGVAMSAYVLIALCCNRKNTVIDRVTYDNSVQSGTSFLLTKLDTLGSDPYTLSIAIYALVTCEVSGWDTAFSTLTDQAITKDGNTHWEQPTSNPPSQEGVAGANGAPVAWFPRYMQSPSRNIELTSYVLLILATRGDVSEVVPVCKWLISQRNSLGGYSGTQDTVMALEALAQCALMLGQPGDGSGVNVVVTAGTFSHSFETITTTNALILQEVELPQSTTRVQIKASGKGSGLVQCNVKYNVYNVTNNNDMVLTVQTSSDGDLLSMEICSSWTGSETSGMCLLEVYILTGYMVTNLDTLRTQGDGSVDRIEIDKEKIVLYFGQLTTTAICRTVTMRPEQVVTGVQPAVIKLYRYYDKESGQTTFYKPTSSSSSSKTPADYCMACEQCCDDPNKPKPKPKAKA